MKRAKKAILKKEEVIHYRYSVICPHCKTGLVGISGESLRISCWFCHNPIELVSK